MKDIFQNNKCLRYLKISKYIENYIIIIYSLWRSILKIFIYFYLLTYFQIFFSILKQFECKKKFIQKNYYEIFNLWKRNIKDLGSLLKKKLIYENLKYMNKNKNKNVSIIL